MVLQRFKSCAQQIDATNFVVLKLVKNPSDPVQIEFLAMSLFAQSSVPCQKGPTALRGETKGKDVRCRQSCLFSLEQCRTPRFMRIQFSNTQTHFNQLGAQGRFI